MSLRTLLCAIAIAGSLVVIICNWVAFLQAMKQKRSYSFMPASAFAVIGVLGLYFYPDEAVSRLAWLPLAADPGIGLVALVVLANRIKRALRRD